MSFLNLLLFNLLIIYSTSYEKYTFNIKNEDLRKCSVSKNNNSPTVEQCTSKTPSLIGRGINESQCCRVIFKEDPFYYYKSKYGENWKKEYMKSKNINENQIESEINRIYNSVNEKKMCIPLNKNLKDLELYFLSNGTIERTLKYNCGNGEETFNKKNFYPSNEEEKNSYDIVECQFETNEKNCYKKSSKLFIDNNQCCWCQENYIFPDSMSSSGACKAFPISGLKNKFEEILKQKKDKKFKMRCICSDKKGKKVTASLNSFYNKISIE